MTANRLPNPHEGTIIIFQVVGTACPASRAAIDKRLPGPGKSLTNIHHAKFPAMPHRYQKSLRFFTLVILTCMVLLIARLSVIAAQDNQTRATQSIVYLPSITHVSGLTPIGEGFNYVTEITHAGDKRLFVAEQAGIVKILHPDGRITVFLDIRPRVISAGGEYGMFDIAFHPGYGDPASAGYGFFYVIYTTGTDEEDARDVDLILSRFRVSADPDIADPNSETLLVVEPQQNPIHKGGSLDFDRRDNSLYMSVGDDFQYLIAQRGNSIKGKILRLDVSRIPLHATDGTSYVEKAIVASGLRNPWRIDVDEATGRLFIGDVGSAYWEEVNLLDLTKTANFGWPCREGPIQLPGFQNDPLCANQFTDAAYHYKNDDAVGTCAIIGGRVYRPASNPADGRYVFGDLCTRELFTLSESGGAWNSTLVGKQLAGLFTTIGDDADGNLYVGSFEASQPIYQMQVP